MPNVRIKDQTTDTALTTGDYVIVDSESEGTRKYDLGALAERVEALEQGGSGLTQAEKQLILTLFCKAAYAEDDAGVVYDALEALWTTTTRTITYNLSHVSSSNTTASIEQGQSYTTTLTATGKYSIDSVTVTMGGVDITSTAYSSGTISIPSVTGNIVITASAVLVAESITAVYTQSGAVYTTDTLDSLKADLVVTANYAGGSSEIVTAYTLSGTLTTGTSTITVEYGGLTTTFTVTVSAQPGMDWSSGVPYDMTDGLIQNMYLNNGVEQAYNGWSISPYMDCRGAFIEFDTEFRYNGEYDASGTYIRNDKFSANKMYGLDDYGVYSFRVSDSTAKVTAAVITPYALPKLEENTVWQANQYYTVPSYTEGAYISASNGNIVSDSNYKYSGFMNCYNATTISDNTPPSQYRSYCFYDGNKEFMSGVEIPTGSSEQGASVAVPTGARFVRLSKKTHNLGVCFKLS